MNANDLLLWLSARRSGSWPQFRGGVVAFAGDDDSESEDRFPLHQQIRLDLQRLAHVEFFARECESGWRVAPPVLALSGSGEACLGILCGARSDGLLDRFKVAATGMELNAIELPSGPTVLTVRSNQERDLSRLAADSQIAFQKDAPLAILSRLPVVSPPRRGQVANEFPEGADWKIEEFDTVTFGWGALQRREASRRRTGLFRFTIHFQPPRHFLRWDGITYEVPRAIGIYTLLRRRRKQVLEYDRSRKTLRIPAGCRPMHLVERGLVLCSGLPPSFDPGSIALRYTQVPEDTASLAAQILLQEIR